MTAGQAFTFGLCLTGIGFTALGALMLGLLILFAHLHSSLPASPKFFQRAGSSFRRDLRRFVGAVLAAFSFAKRGPRPLWAALRGRRPSTPNAGPAPSLSSVKD
jgi:hypothetical protein